MRHIFRRGRMGLKTSFKITLKIYYFCKCNEKKKQFWNNIRVLILE